MSKHPLVTIARGAYKEIVAQAIGSSVETGGILVGKETRGRNCKVLHIGEMEHGRATTSWLKFTEVQRAEAVRVAEDRWPGLLYLGEWHSHCYDEDCILAHLPQISENDAASMLVGKVEIIAMVFPGEGKRQKNRWDMKWHFEGNIRCGLEAWLRVKKKQVVPCRLEVR